MRVGLCTSCCTVLLGLERRFQCCIDLLSATALLHCSDLCVCECTVDALIHFHTVQLQPFLPAGNVQLKLYVYIYKKGEFSELVRMSLYLIHVHKMAAACILNLFGGPIVHI